MKAVSPLSHLFITTLNMQTYTKHNVWRLSLHCPIYSQPNNKRHIPCCNLSTTVRNAKQVTAAEAIWTTNRAVSDFDVFIGLAQNEYRW